MNPTLKNHLVFSRIIIIKSQLEKTYFGGIGPLFWFYVTLKKWTLHEKNLFYTFNLFAQKKKKQPFIKKLRYAVKIIKKASTDFSIFLPPPPSSV